MTMHKLVSKGEGAENHIVPLRDSIQVGQGFVLKMPYLGNAMDLDMLSGDATKRVEHDTGAPAALPGTSPAGK